MSKVGKHLATFGAAALVVGAGLGWFLLQRSCHRAQTGEPIGLVITGSSILLIDRLPEGEHQSEEIRIDVHDLASGERTGRRFFDHVGGCTPATADRVWCRLDVLGLYDARTLDKVVGVGDAIAEAKLGAPVPEKWRVDGPLLYHLLDDGRVASIDAASLAVTYATAPGALDAHLGGFDVGRCATDEALRALPGARPKKGKPKPVDPAAKPAFIEPRPLLDSRTLEPLLAGGDMVILHRSSADPQKAAAQMSRVDRAGKAVWTADLGECAAATAIGDAIVVATGRGRHRAIAIDPERGGLRWTID
jgi:hypothetical protein